MEIIAEIGSVHDGSLGNARKIIELASRIGASVVKFQVHIAEHESLENAPSPEHFKDEPRYEYFRRTAFSENEWQLLLEHCQAQGVRFLASPFSIEAVDLLDRIGCNMYKVASGEVTNIPMLHHLAKKGASVYLSTGMSTWSEIDNAVLALEGCAELFIMQCTSAYPCPVEMAGVNLITELRERYKGCNGVGFSDHTEGLAAGVTARVLGAVVIEKHLTFSKDMYGSDAPYALEPEQFKAYCNALKEAHMMMTCHVDKDDVASSMRGMKDAFEKSIVARRSLRNGVKLQMTDIAFKKPGTGLSAARYKEFIGRSINKDIPENHMFSEGDFK